MALLRSSFALAVALLLASIAPGSAAKTGQGTRLRTRLNVNPIRRVVTMLQMMQKKVEAEGNKEQELYDAFMCYCKNGVGDLTGSIKAAEAKIVQLESGIEETDSSVKQLASDIKGAKTDRKEAEETSAKAAAIRDKESKEFAKSSAESKTNIAGMGKAIDALEKGMGGAFLQTNAAAASMIQKMSVTMDISDTDRDVLASFLSKGQQDSSGYAPSSGEITGILKQMKETMQGDLTDAMKTEDGAIKDFDGLTKAKTKQITTLTKEIESKTARSGEAGVTLAEMKEDLSDTTKTLAQDKKFLVDVTVDCSTKEKEKQTNDKLRADELLALADTIKLLNDDDALDLFKKTLPTPSLLQVAVSSKAMKQRALSILAQGRKHHKRDFRLNLISMALRGKKVSFDKVVKMIDDMASLLGREQKGDDTKKAYCEKELDSTEDELKEVNADIKDLEKAIDEHVENIKSVGAEIKALTEGIESLDKQVAAATKQRKEENAEYQETMASDGAAKELLELAKNRLAKFYSPKMYKAPAKRELSEAEQITVNMGGTLAPTNAPGGIAGTDITAVFAQYQSDAQTQDSLGFLQVASRSRAKAKRAAPPPAPETAGAYKKAGQDSNGVVQMLDLLVADLDKEMAAMKVEETESQKEYEQFIKDSADKRASDAKSISDKSGTKVELEANTLKMKQEKKGKGQESYAKVETLQGLHSECDWLLKVYDTRKQARVGEIESLTNAKSVLSGADYSFLQTAIVSRHN
jgi:septal ring factor EnvC (AmiA/AmiB activator)